MKSLLHSDGPRAELAELEAAYGLERIDERFPRTRAVACPLGGSDCRDPCCICTGGVYRTRILWVNARAAYAARLPAHNATLLVMDFGDWLSVKVYWGELWLTDLLEVGSAGGSLEAHTTDYNGGLVGSAVYNPEALRGRVYRALRPAPDGTWKDGYCRPADIVAHLLETPAEYRRGAAPLRGSPLYLAEV